MQSNQTGLSQGTMQQSSGNSNNRDNSNRRGGNNNNQSINNGGANYDQYQIESQLQFQHNNQSLQNLPPAQPALATTRQMQSRWPVFSTCRSARNRDKHSTS